MAGQDERYSYPGRRNDKGGPDLLLTLQGGRMVQFLS